MSDEEADWKRARDPSIVDFCFSERGTLSDR